MFFFLVLFFWVYCRYVDWIEWNQANSIASRNDGAMLCQWFGKQKSCDQASGWIYRNRITLTITECSRMRQVNVLNHPSSVFLLQFVCRNWQHFLCDMYLHGAYYVRFRSISDIKRIFFFLVDKHILNCSSIHSLILQQYILYIWKNGCFCLCKSWRENRI